MERSLLALYSLTHFWVDLSCAFLLLRTLPGQPNFSLYLLLYNFCAFALQMPLGLLADRLDRNSALAALGCGLTALACFLTRPLFIAVIAGVGNALFHLGGGIDVLNSSRRRSAPLGVFISPGALGLFIGSCWGRGTFVPLWVPPVGLLFLAIAICQLCPARRPSGNISLDLTAPAGYFPLVPLFLVVVLRSYMGMNQAFPWKSRWTLALTLALALGKAAGGFLADRLSPRPAAAFTLLLAAGLYWFSTLPLPGILAVLLFNMTMPITLWAVSLVMPGAKGFTFGLLTFALFLGFLPTFLGWHSLLTHPAAYAGISLLSLILLWRPLKREAARC